MTKFVPRKGGHYWYISATGFCGCATYIEYSDEDLLLIGQGNAFLTREEAEDYRERMINTGREKAGYDKIRDRDSTD